MKKRIAYISLYFFTVLLIFILQKPLFMLYNGSIEKGFGFADYMQVMVHGASLDAATAGYLTAFPFLLVLISIWFRKFPLKKILYGYYILAAALISIIFVVDVPNASLCSDVLHFDAEGAQELGNKMFQLIEKKKLLK